MKLKRILLALTLALPVQAKQVAIVIDDIGYHQNDLQALQLPGQLTYAVLPHTPYAERFATQALEKRLEILLHAPMQALGDQALGPGALTDDMSKAQFQQALRESIASLKGVKGVNNHMGSKLTALKVPMAWTMEVLKEKGLYFLDSKTTNQSQAQSMASVYGVKNIARHVFLDNITSEEQLRFRFEELKRLARDYEYAVAIAHPYPETFAFLQQALPELEEAGLELVPLSTLVQKRTVQLAQAKRTQASNLVSNQSALNK